MAPATKANYKSYEAQARMVRAIVAAHPEVKWNYKEIQKFYGSDMSEHALNHRFRPIRAAVEALKIAVDKGMDCKDVPLELGEKKKDIAKLFGESTPDGIQFQFRSIKKDAEKLREAVAKGNNPAAALKLNGGGGSGVNSSTSTPRAKGTPARSRASGSGISAKRTKRLSISDEEEDDDDVDYDEMDTPTRDRGRERVLTGRVTKTKAPNATPSSSFNNNNNNATTPSRAAPTAAAAMLSQPVDLTGSESEVNTPENAAALDEDDQKPIPDAPHVDSVSLFNNPNAFSQVGGADQWIGGMTDDSSFEHSFTTYNQFGRDSYMDGDGEI